MSVGEVSAVTRRTAEGVKSCASILELARRHGVDMPIVEGVVAVVDGRLTPRAVVELLMARSRKGEQD